MERVNVRIGSMQALAVDGCFSTSMGCQTRLLTCCQRTMCLSDLDVDAVGCRYHNSVHTSEIYDIIV